MAKINDSKFIDVTSKLDSQFEKQNEVLKKLIEPSVAVKSVIQPSPAMTVLTKYNSGLNTLLKGIAPTCEVQQMLSEYDVSYKLSTNIARGVLAPYSNAISKISDIQATTFLNSAEKLLSGYTSIPKMAFVPPIMGWLKNIAPSPITGLLVGLESFISKDFDKDSINEIYLDAMYETHWFPNISADITLITDILDILDETRKGKKRETLVDKAVFNYYRKNVIEKIRKSWRTLGIPKFKLRILNQAVNAYYRKEYALTVSALVSLWEGIIAEKVNKPDDYRVSRQTRENLTKLIDENDGCEELKSFCTEFIFYDCKKKEDVKQDVPGRHGIAHSWYSKYPNQKMALNAILFTDCLLNLNSIQ